VRQRLPRGPSTSRNSEMRRPEFFGWGHPLVSVHWMACALSRMVAERTRRWAAAKGFPLSPSRISPRNRLSDNDFDILLWASGDVLLTQGRWRRRLLRPFRCRAARKADARLSAVAAEHRPGHADAPGSIALLPSSNAPSVGVTSDPQRGHLATALLPLHPASPRCPRFESLTAHQSKRALPEHRKRPLIFGQRFLVGRPEKRRKSTLRIDSRGNDVDPAFPLASTSRRQRPARRSRLAAGVESCVVLRRAVRAQGYAGSYSILEDYVPVGSAVRVQSNRHYHSEPNTEANDYSWHLGGFVAENRRLSASASPRVGTSGIPTAPAAVGLPAGTVGMSQPLRASATNPGPPCRDRRSACRAHDADARQRRNRHDRREEGGRGRS
jgi:hypothetical protein